MPNEPQDSDQLKHDDVEGSDNEEDQNPDVIPGADDNEEDDGA